MRYDHANGSYSYNNIDPSFAVSNDDISSSTGNVLPTDAIESLHGHKKPDESKIIIHNVNQNSIINHDNENITDALGVYCATI